MFSLFRKLLADGVPASEKLTTQVKNLLEVFDGKHNRQELQGKLGLANREHFRKVYLQPAIDDEWVELTIPEKTRSSKQQYRITEKGKAILSQ